MPDDVEQQDSASWIDRVELAIALALPVEFTLLTCTIPYASFALGEAPASENQERLSCRQSKNHEVGHK